MCPNCKTSQHLKVYSNRTQTWNVCLKCGESTKDNNMTPKEKFWEKFKQHDEICLPDWEAYKRVRIECEIEDNKHAFQASDGSHWCYEDGWKLWTPPAKSKKIVLKAYMMKNHLNNEWMIGFTESSIIDRAAKWATFNPSDGSYSIEVEE